MKRRGQGWVTAAALLTVVLLLRVNGIGFMNGSCGKPSNGALAYYCPADDTIHLNHKAILRDYACGLCYFRRPTTNSGQQKAEVFARMDPDAARLRRWLERQPDPGQAYVRFILEHERAHRALHRSSWHHPLMHPDTIRKEMEANFWAYNSLGI